MKNANSIIFIFLVIFFSLNSCTDTNEDINNYDSNIPLAVSISLNEESKSNPNLHSNWENINIIKLNGRELNVDVPWINKEGHAIDIPDNYRNDIKKEDGWKLLFHTLIDSEKSDPNYIIFYNKYTGILKGFYYNPAAVANSNFVWAMEAKAPTSIFYQNEKCQEPLDSKKKSQAMTTSNISNNTITNFGQLNRGWNCFAFELPYGDVNNKPIISIRGYSVTNSDFTGKGDYAGQIVIPISSGSENQLQEISGGISKVLGSISKIFPGASLTTPIQGASILSTIFGQSILSLSKSKAPTTIYAKSSGTINLTGNITSPQGGFISPLIDVDLRKANREDLGLWNLRKSPKIRYGKYSEAFQKENSKEFMIHVDYNTDIERSNVIINPSIISLVESYSIQSIAIFMDKNNKSSFIPQDGIYGKHITDDIYEVSGRFIKNYAYQIFDRDINNKNPQIPIKFFTKDNHFKLYPTRFYITVCLKLKYKDGKEVLSYRNFKTTNEVYDNSSDVEKRNIHRNKIIILDCGCSWQEYKRIIKG